MKQRSVAILLAFFLGGFGIHKFYLGNNFAGIMYLIFSWTFIPAIIAIFDFVGLILMTDQAFNAQYNLQVFASGNVLDPSGNSIKSLKHLKELYDQGIITAEEYEEKRKKFLNSI